MQQGIKKLQWFEYLKVVFLEILNALLCWVFANQVTYYELLLVCICICILYTYIKTHGSESRGQEEAGHT